MQLNKMMNLQPPYQLSELATAVYSSSEVLDKVKSLSGDVNLTFTKENMNLYTTFLGFLANHPIVVEFYSKI